MKHITFNKNEIMDLLFTNSNVYIELPLTVGTCMMVSRGVSHFVDYKRQPCIEVRFCEKSDDAYASYSTEYFNIYNIENAADAVLMRHASEDPMQITNLSKDFELTFEKE